jgi:serine protease Do
MSISVKWCAPVVLAIGLGLGSCGEAKSQYSRETPISQAYKKTKDAIVTLKVTRSSEWGGKRGGTVGTGVIVDERGYVITNHHVIAEAGKITATLSDKTTVEARIHVEDPKHDLAILRLVVKKHLKALSFGPGTDLMVGETVIAIGNPFGYTGTVSTGIISALDREIEMPSGTTLTNLIQTNASINPGNSGGPLLNINGELIGINVALRHDAQGIAFALNAETVKEVLRKHLSVAKVSKVGHGMVCSEKVTTDDKAHQKVVVEDVNDDSTGVKKGDVLVKVGRLAVKNRFDVERALWGYKPGDKVEAAVLRGGKLTNVSLTLTGSETQVTSANKGDH